MADGYYFKMVCFYSLTSPVFFVLVKEAVVSPYSLYQFHESSVGKELFSRFLLKEEEEGRRREEEEGRRREGGEERREKRRGEEENRRDKRREERREKIEEIVVRLPMCVTCCYP